MRAPASGPIIRSWSGRRSRARRKPGPTGSSRPTRRGLQAGLPRAGSVRATGCWCISRTAPRRCWRALRSRGSARSASPPMHWPRVLRSPTTPSRRAPWPRSRRRALPGWSPPMRRDLRFVVVSGGEGADLLASLFADPAPAHPAAEIGHRGDHVHHRHHRKAQGRGVDACERAVGQPLQRAGVRPPRRRRQPDLAAAVSCRRPLLVVSSGAVGRRHGGAAAALLGEPVLARVPRASRDAGVARAVHLDGAAEPDRAGAAFLSPVDGGPRRPRGRSRTTAFRPSCRHGA